MSWHLQETVARREALVRVSAAQRELLALEAAQARRTLWFVESAARAAHAATARPLLIAVAAGLVLALGPRRVFARGSRAVVALAAAWRLGGALRTLFRQ